MDHAAGKGKFTVAAQGDRKKWTPEDIDSAAEGSNFVDLWLAENPGNRDEEIGGLSAHKVASAIAPGAMFGPFAAEAKAISDGIKKYGSLEAFERATSNVDYFADSHLVIQTRLPSRPRPTNCFESHLGAEGVHRTALNIRPVSPEFIVSAETVEALEQKHPDVKHLGLKTGVPAVIDVPQPDSRIIAPSKRVNLSDDFGFE